MTARLFITGMVRSGTTLISRAIDAHPNIVCAPDPCLGFFRSVRNELHHRTYGSCPELDEPFTDHFFSPNSELNMLQEASFNLQIEFESLETTRERLRRFNLDSNSTRLVSVVDELGGEETYIELLDSILGLVHRVYGKGKDKAAWIGFKQTWVEAFVPVFFNTWSDMVCVHIIRDPRAVLASWLGTSDLTHDYPLLMILRHWRKSAALASLFSRHFGDNYRVLRYEDFVSDPEKALRNVLNRMDLPYDSRMTDTVRFRSGAGGQWQANTSYEEAKGISRQFVDRWRERLSKSDLQFLEDMCEPEMRRWNYSRVTKPGGPGSLLRVPNLSKRLPGERGWIEKHTDEYRPNALNQAKEFYRWHLLHHPDVARILCRDDLSAILIDPDLLEI